MKYINYIFVVMLAVIFSGCAVMQGKSTASQYTSDTAITTQIKTKLIRSDIVSAPNIHVETQNGVVQLSGFVSNFAQVREATQLARSVDGVKGVQNNLIIAPSSKLRRHA